MNKADKKEQDDGQEHQGLDASMIVSKKSKVKKSEGLWLTSFADLSILLMCFFVMQISYSTPDKRKYEQVKNALQSMNAKKPVQEIETLESLSKKITKAIKDKKLEKTVNVNYDINGLSIEFKNAMLFAVGSADVDARYAKLAEQVMGAIAKAPGDYRLIFEGHTDDLPVTSGKFRSNWDLSSARGIALLDSFKKRGVEESRMSIQSYAHTRPKVGYGGLKGEDLKTARAANRRVVIRIE
jgi:chemotaxis protein MotB